MASFVYASDAALAERFTALTGVEVAVRIDRNNSRKVRLGDKPEMNMQKAIAAMERAIERAEAAKFFAS